MGAFVGMKIGLARQEERHLALDRRFTEHASAVNERLKVLSERSHSHAQHIHEYGMVIREQGERLRRVEERGDER